MVGAKKVPVSMDVGMYGSFHLFVYPYLLSSCMYVCMHVSMHVNFNLQQ